MIDEIHVQNLALIRDATLVPGTGLTVLTGETGAGKTALLTAVKLLLGARADKDAVREGCSSLVCEGRFLNVPVAAAADSEDAPESLDASEAPATDQRDEEVVVSRTVTADGKSRAALDGRMANAKQLAARIAPTVDLCGQHEQQRLMKPSSHVQLLDAWMGAESEGTEAHTCKQRYQQALQAAREAAAELQRVQEASAASSAQLDNARFTLARIGEVNPQSGEYEQLEQSLAKAEHAEALATAANTAYSCLSGEEGALDALYTAAQALESVAAYDAALGEHAKALHEAAYVLEDVSRDARDYRDSVDFDPAQLAFQQERLSAFLGLLRQWGPRMEDVFAARDAAQDLVSLVDDAGARIAAAQRAVDQAEQQLAAAAEELSALRHQAAPRFAQEVTAQMARLEMAESALECQVADLPRAEWNTAGPQAVEFAFRPGKGMQARPLTRIASGGELSRVLLAIKVVLGAQDNVDTLVFDEVDAGVGGATAVSLAAVLADLATTHQVLVVTHLAQVAVRAQTHYVVRKAGENVPETTLDLVEGESRVAEVARMLSGESTEVALAHARQMLADMR
ncbi:MAG: DNA repair protein RecN [Coriobacteriia bacterium]|nr:DNA repair protein RecN [Coriobacteriia bacterium]